MPEEANPPEKPVDYGDHAKKFLQQLISDLEVHHQRVFERVWKDNGDIGSVEVLKSIAIECGLDPIEFEKSLTNRVYREQVDADFQLAVEHKIWSIPSYKTEKGVIQVNHFEDLPSVNELKEIL